MVEQEPGGMDIHNQEQTFDGFIRFTIRAVVIIMALANA